VLKDWEEILPKFVKVMPEDLKRVLRERQEAELEVAS
jgi:glutamate synthase domain-containing protein 3